MNLNHGTQSPNTCFILQQDMPNDLFVEWQKTSGLSSKKSQKLKRKWKKLEILLTYANSMEQSPS